MFLLDDVVVYSASDISQAAGCEFALLRQLDHKLGRAPLQREPDAMLERTAELGAAHEARWKARYFEQFGPWNAETASGVYEVEPLRPEAYAEAAQLRARAHETREAMLAGADVVAQGAFFDGRFHGIADFLVKQPGGSYAVYDAKLARHAKVTGVLQLAAYGDQLRAAGIPTAATVHLVLGDRSVTDHQLRDLLPLFRHRRAKLEQLLDSHVGGSRPVGWHDSGITVCGRCDLCLAEAEGSRDLLLVAGLSMVQRTRLHTAGITTIDELAGFAGTVNRIGTRVLDRLRAQAALQVRQNPPSGVPGPVSFELFAPEVVHALPAKSAGDIFFDFEGDPLWTDGDSADAGLEYLFGWTEIPTGSAAGPEFRTLWAHNRAEEKAALQTFVHYVGQRRLQYPDLHVFHYAPYEVTALKRLAGRHGTCEAELADLLRSGVFIDLFSTVRESLRVSQPSYSIKKLEPLYMESRDGLDNAADSITDYAQACELRDRGDLTGFDTQLKRIGDYNYDDCRSTFLLREWLVDRAAQYPRIGASDVQEEVTDGPDVTEETESDALVGALQTRAAETTNAADSLAYNLLAAALGYHWREETPFWWEHFDRLSQPVDEWSQTKDVVLCDDGAQHPASDNQAWQAPTGRQKNWRRTVQITGEVESGSTLTVGTEMWPMYEHATSGMHTSRTATRGWNNSGVKIVEVHTDQSGTRITMEESAGEPDWTALPMALVPKPGPPHQSQKEAIAALSRRVLAEQSFPDLAALKILRREHPIGVAEFARQVRESASGGVTSAISDVLQGMDNSYVAVQGPPGTGKTYTGARVLRDLVQRGWKVGVVAQSHAVVENFLQATLDAGVPAECVGKKSASEDKTVHPWRKLAKAGDWTSFLAGEGGRIAGGTAWDFSNRKRVGAEQLDLLVIDEAGQYALANTLAVAGAARRLLLLGDPQQLPQVSQGAHPFPVDQSALGWLVERHPTMPDEMGFFLDKTFRMHPQLCEPVSDLSYDGLLSAMPKTGNRSVSGIPPGLHSIFVNHSENRTESHEEARVVVDLVRDITGRRWQDPDNDEDRDMTCADIIVVAAYNSQVSRLRSELDAAGFGRTRVGTVDKFQGQEAPVAIVSLAASSAHEVPRGMEFLINRNRLNVAISRGQFAAFLVHSPRLRDYLPAKANDLEELGAFIRLGSPGRD